MLSLENISLYKNDQKIFADVSVSVFLGGCLLITGKNGSGKTSLLKIIAGISKQSTGKILWDQENIQNFRSDFNGDLQFIGHKNFLKPQLTIVENLAFYADLTDSAMLLQSALKFFQLQDKVDIKIKNLSMGWQKRVLLSKLIACPATIWILDEPTTNLDLEGKKLLLTLIESKIDNGGMVLLSSHDEMFFKLGQKLNIEDFASDLTDNLL